MYKILLILYFLYGLIVSAVTFPDGAVAVLFTTFWSLIVLYVIQSKFKKESDMLSQIFLGALLARLVFGLIVHLTDLRAFFGGDAITYDALGYRLVEIFYGASTNDIVSYRAMNMASGWGMNYLTAFVYFFTGRNPFAAQSFCAVIGAAKNYLYFNLDEASNSIRKVERITRSDYYNYLICSKKIAEQIGLLD